MVKFKTKYYPVDLDKKTIINLPFNTERKICWKFKEKPFIIPIKGERLNRHECYKKFEIKEEEKRE